MCIRQYKQESVTQTGSRLPVCLSSYASVQWAACGMVIKDKGRAEKLQRSWSKEHECRKGEEWKRTRQSLWECKGHQVASRTSVAWGLEVTGERTLKKTCQGMDREREFQVSRWLGGWLWDTWSTPQSSHGSLGNRFCSNKVWVHSSPPSTIACVPRWKLLNLPVPQFLHLQDGENNS
jgi:hypothetical protein